MYNIHRKGKDGELTAEIFETMFPDNPEQILNDFLSSGSEYIVCIKKLNETDVVVSKITPEYARALLKEFSVLRG